MKIHKLVTGFVDVPEIITLNIFTVGCEHGCEGCHVPQLQDPEYKDSRILEESDFDCLKEDFYGAVCWMGGDPLFQEYMYVKVSTWIKENYPGTKIICFTGYDYDKISSFVKQVTDVIIDGTWQGIPYQEPESNQKIYHNGRKIDYKELERYVLS